MTAVASVTHLWVMADHAQPAKIKDFALIF